MCVCVWPWCVDLSPRSVCIWKGGVNPCLCVYMYVCVCVCVLITNTHKFTHETSITSGQLKHTYPYANVGGANLVFVCACLYVWPWCVCVCVCVHLSPRSVGICRRG